ncbi:hypothetical protein L195_g046921 [Trifolium pratense]|uniref:Uncharacterized protein n=1 Tax=Trifolium pratense TaxID=57577 RepID=A0A2K3MJ61_TRIPR|nr:hypothetical protein L195_g046921 [Trifolium pratense]
MDMVVVDKASKEELTYYSLTIDANIDGLSCMHKHESAAYARQQLAHKHKKSQMEFSVPKEMKMSFEDSGNGNMMHKDNKDKDEFSFLVKSVKMKSKQILDGKTRWKITI